MMGKNRVHFPLMLMGMLSLITALLGGLSRIGWPLPPPIQSFSQSVSMIHGPLMVSGFLGTLISLERAVALKKGFTYIAPLLTGAGAILLITGILQPYGPLLITAGSLILVVVFIYIYRIQAGLHIMIMGIGALLWFAGNLAWLKGAPVSQVVMWWAGFLVLTIAGERLELTRLLQHPVSVKTLFIIDVAIFITGIMYTGVNFESGIRLTGVGMIFLSLWLIKYDMARKTIHQPGLPRFIAICLLSGYVWLLISGIILMSSGGVIAGPLYDAMLHTVFLGFVFVMIFGHAPIIFPAVLGKPMNFHPRFYIHLILLHITLILRISGDLANSVHARQWGGLLNVLAIVIFFLNTISAVLKKPISKH